MTIRALVFSTLYPNAVQPRHGIFVEQRLRQLIATRRVEARVVAPVPWFPSTHPVFGTYARFAQVPRHDVRHGIAVDYPRHLVPPKIGMTLVPALMAASVRPALKKIRASDFDFDLIDAHYLYPDGVAAALLARSAGRPFVMTARGTDVNVIAQMALPGRMIRWAAGRAAAIVTVSRALADALVELGIDEKRLHVLPNGVDGALFAPRSRAAARAATGLSPGTVLSVGNLTDAKGHHLAIEALTSVPGVRLEIVGDGPERQRLETLARALGVADRVGFHGNVAQERLVDYYCAADALVLATAREGMPNVVLEALSCGTPVIATRVGGIPEIVDPPATGRLLDRREAGAVATAIRDVLDNPPDPVAIRDWSQRFGWARTTAGVLKLFESLAGTGATADAPLPRSH